MAARDSALGYDELPYPSAPYPYSHCDHLAQVARLFGIHAAAADRCRVLEIGCADGANLIPMALTLPHSEFVGIDLSPRQIAVGQNLVERLSLKNIELRAQNLAEFSSQTPFDYIIVHGVFSWTTPAVQTQLLELCRQQLAPQGVCFISYNVYPGWQRRTIVRDWVLRATGGIESTAEQLHAARSRIRGLRQVLERHGGENQQECCEELVRLESWSDGYLRHDLLEDSNEPLFFGDFVNRAETHGLKFFAEADVASMAGAGLPAALVAGVQRLGKSLVEREQLLDLVTNRAFRQSLLCRAQCAAQSQIDVAAVRSSYVVSTLRAATSLPGAAVRFVSQSGFAVTVQEPLVAAALLRLEQAWPCGEWFGELMVDADESVREELANVLLAGLVERAIELHTDPLPLTNEIADYPIASSLARCQATAGGEVTNLRHDVVRLDARTQQLLPLLDGTRDRAALAKELGLNDLGSSAVDDLLRQVMRWGLLSR